ncbi:MAG: GH1 family beta-glucosidase [Acidimicrobiales bacterium]
MPAPSDPAGGAGAVTFPEGFLWGVSTASYQIEGAVGEDGRGPSIWDTFSHRPGAVRNGDNGDVACDHYHRVEEDLDLLAALGVGAYRFSVAWPRVQPTGKGPANQPGLDFYRGLVDGLRRRGIEPVPTLYHWDLPQPLEDAGGWVVRDTSERFAEYAALVADALGDGVDRWTTLNEPWCSAWHGYASGHHAPGHHDLGEAVAATHHLLLAHGLAVGVLRAASSNAQVGITLNMETVAPATDHPADVAAATLVDGNLNRLFAEPLLRGTYPEDLLRHYQGRRPGFEVVADGDLEVVSRAVDFLGVNFYKPGLVAAAGREVEAAAAGYAVPPQLDPVWADLGAVGVLRPSVARTLMGWEIDPAGLTDLLVEVTGRYGSIPLYVTENGAACADYVGPDGAVHDADRIAYLDGHLRAAHDAIASGVDLRGYFVWSLLDNFEWGHGYQRRFGLTWVDYPTGRRVPKDSFAWYRAVVAANGPEDAPAG